MITRTCSNSFEELSLIINNIKEDEFLSVRDMKFYIRESGEVSELTKKTIAHYQEYFDDAAIVSMSRKNNFFLQYGKVNEFGETKIHSTFKDIIKFHTYAFGSRMWSKEISFVYENDWIYKNGVLSLDTYFVKGQNLILSMQEKKPSEFLISKN